VVPMYVNLRRLMTDKGAEYAPVHQSVIVSSAQLRPHRRAFLIPSAAGGR
jgi:hypothetical protein